jgi:hypothetical protein
VKKGKEKRERERERERDKRERKKWKKRGRNKIDQTVFNRASTAPSKMATERDNLITNGNPFHKRIPLIKTDPLGHTLGKKNWAFLKNEPYTNQNKDNTFSQTLST